MSQPRNTNEHSQFQRGATDLAQSYIPILQFLVVCGGVFGAGTWFNRIETKIESIESTLEKVFLDRWSATDMEHWAEVLKVQNPNMTLPEVRPSGPRYGR